MSVSIQEQETTINFSRDEDKATVWTSDKTMMTKLDKLCEKSPDQYRIVDVGKSRDGEHLSTTYEMPKSMLSFRAVKRSRELTVEEINAMRERALRNLHAKK